MSDGRDDDRLPGNLPRTRVRRNWRTWLYWLVPVAAVVLAGWFVYEELFKAGATIRITFDDAAGLEPGKSQVKYRGVKIGSVEDVELTRDHRHVRVKVSLEQSSDAVAREGSKFWIVQPRVRLLEIRGLSTIVGGDYIAVEPGEGKPQTSFTGHPEPPPPISEEEGLRIVLLAENAHSLKEHTPVLYRGINVGEVHRVDLGPKSQDVKIYVDIKKGYERLVRMNSKFWNAGGIDVSLGLSGLDVSAQSARTLIAGGIAFATPDDRGAKAAPDTAYRLYDSPDPEWLKWAPAIAHGEIPAGDAMDRSEGAP